MLSRKVCGSFVAEMRLICFRLRAWISMEKHAATLTIRAVANSKPRRPTQPVDFAEGLRKLRGRVAPCLQASAHVARVAQWVSSLHRLRRNTAFLPYLNVTCSFCANTGGNEICRKNAPRGLRKQTMNHMCRGSSRKGPLGPRQGCGRVRGSLKGIETNTQV